MTEWKDISTAPKDGTHVLLWVEDGGWYVGGWNGKSWDDGNYFDSLAATHWQPLPPPPPKGEGS
ncbi:MAG: DUF551 domain-containing protein [Desulfurellales bacterium]|nr:MAG: DUF551 domain-containing protein [Desulfurellales bacterium]